MGRDLALAALVFVFLAAPAIINSEAGERANDNTSAPAGLFWSTAKEESDLLRQTEPEDDHLAEVAVNDRDEFDGGFSSLDGMLQWAIGHSDPAKLQETAKDVQHLSPSELEKRQQEIKELMDKLKMPSDAQLMQIAIDDLNNLSLSLEDRQRALQELLVLVEPIDNANDLNKLGGLSALIRQLNHSDPDVRTISAWVLGKASQNHAIIQKEILELGALKILVKMMKSTIVEEAVKAIYAVSALIRDSLAGQELFVLEAGDLILQVMQNNPSNDIRLLRKAVLLVADLAGCQIGNEGRAKLSFFGNRSLLKSVVDLTASTDLDLQEKALVAIKNLLQLRTTVALILKDFCDLDGALGRMKMQLQELLVEEHHRDYAMDMEILRREVELLFHKKLGEATEGSNTTR